MTDGIGVSGLSVSYGDVVAVDGLDLTARPGEVTCLVGPNGAGKTSTIEVLEGLRRPGAGSVQVLGLDPQRDRAKLAPRLGVMLQEGGIYPGVRVGEAMQHAAALYPEAVDPATLLEQVGLTSLVRRPYRRLSGGEQRRLALALALVGRPAVVMLDEPTTGVDPFGRRMVRDLIGRLKDEGATILLSSHELDEVERVADRVILIDRGRLLTDGPVADLVREHGSLEDAFFRLVTDHADEAGGGEVGPL